MINITINEIKTKVIRKFANYEIQSDLPEADNSMFLRKQSLNNFFVLNLYLR